MTLTDLLGLLIGRRQSILKIAQSRSALWVGLLLVFSAAMAREYDRHWLLAEWWHLLLPFGASLGLSLLQFSLFWGRRDLLKSTATFTGAYRSFLACFWMTAPLAWFYAIPYERMLSPADAMAANLWTLAIVSALRGLIICRVLQVTANLSYWGAFFVSLLPAQILLAGTIFVTPIRIVEVMSGIRSTPEQDVLTGTMFLVLGETVYVGWLVVIASLTALSRIRCTFTPAVQDGRRTGALAWLTPVVVSLGFIACLPWTQPPWQRAGAVDELMRQGKIDEALFQMATHRRSAFPPDWRPPPESADVYDKPNLFNVLDRIESIPPNAWPRQYYVGEFDRVFGNMRVYMMHEELQPRIDEVLLNLPDAAPIRKRFQEEMRAWHARDELPTTQP